MAFIFVRWGRSLAWMEMLCAMDRHFVRNTKETNLPALCCRRQRLDGLRVGRSEIAIGSYLAGALAYLMHRPRFIRPDRIDESLSVLLQAIARSGIGTVFSARERLEIGSRTASPSRCTTWPPRPQARHVSCCFGLLDNRSRCSTASSFSGIAAPT